MTEFKALAIPCAFLSLSLASPAFAETDAAPTKPSSPSKVENPGSEAPKSSSAKEDPTKRARANSQRAHKRSENATAAQKKLVAKRLTSLAGTWKKVALAIERAALLESEASKIEKATLELASQTKRAASLVEQTEARRSRALGRLKELGLSDASPQSPVFDAPKASDKKETK